MSTCKYPIDKSPCVVTSSAKIEDVFENIEVSVFDQCVYRETILVSSSINCAATALLTESLGFIFSRESYACLLHSYTSRCHEKRRRYLPNGSRLMFGKGRFITSNNSELDARTSISPLKQLIPHPCNLRPGIGACIVSNLYLVLYSLSNLFDSKSYSPYTYLVFWHPDTFVQ